MEGFNLRGLADRLEVHLAWVPDWVVGLTLLTIATAIALGLHRLLVRTSRQLFGQRSPFMATLIEHTRGPARLAMVIIAIRIAVAAAPFDVQVAVVIGRLLNLAIIGLFGWLAIRALEIASALYLRRFRIDVEDNLLARKHITQIRILKRAVVTLIVVFTFSAGLMTFDAVRQYGVSLFASAGAAGLILGLAAQPVLSNLIAGVQLAVTQPIRLDDVVIIEGEWGRIEEINATYVVVRIWDLRRLIVPLRHFIEQPFQNWTRASAEILGTVFFYVDYTVPVDRVRTKVEEIVRASSFWDGKVVGLVVTDAREATLELRALASAASSGDAWNLRCEVREKVVDFLQREYPGALPHRRAYFEMATPPAGERLPGDAKSVPQPAGPV